MNEREIITLALDLMNRHLINDNNNYRWDFKFNSRKQALGICKVNRETLRASIELSKYMIGNDKKHIEETLLHEIAHGIDYERNGTSSHGYKWQKIMRELGQEPNRLASGNKSKQFRENIEHKYTAECLSCKRVFNVNRLSRAAKEQNGKAHYCNCQTGKKDKLFLTWKQNY